MLRVGLFVLVSVLWIVNSPQSEGVTEVKQRYNCCAILKVPLSKGCEDSFLIGDTVMARVKDDDAQVRGPFELLRDRSAMLVLDCVNFSHQIFCKLEDLHVVEKISHNEAIPCTQEDF